MSEKLSKIEERLEQIEKRIYAPDTIQGEKRLLTTEEAASFIGMTVDGLRGLTRKKLIPFYKPNGKNMYFDVDELTSWQKKHHFEPINDGVQEAN